MKTYICENGILQTRNSGIHIIFYEKSSGYVIQGALDELYNVIVTSFIKVFIRMTTSVRFVLSHAFLAYIDSLPDTLSTIFSLVTVRVIFNKCNIKYS